MLIATNIISFILGATIATTLMFILQVRKDDEEENVMRWYEDDGK